MLHSGFARFALLFVLLGHVARTCKPKSAPTRNVYYIQLPSMPSPLPLTNMATRTTRRRKAAIGIVFHFQSTTNSNPRWPTETGTCMGDLPKKTPSFTYIVQYTIYILCMWISMLVLFLSARNVHIHIHDNILLRLQHPATFADENKQ